MKAVRIHEFGGPEVLKYEDVPDPELRKDYVLVRIRACALNHLDLWVRKGLPGVKLPHILGSDIAGEVAECGEYITDLKPGTRVLLSPMLYCGHCEQCNSGRQNFCPQFAVLGNNADGGNCELIAVPRANVIPIPDSLGFVEAASVPLVFLTAWHMLVGNAKSAGRADGAGVGSGFGRGVGGHPDLQDAGRDGYHDGGRRAQAGKGARTGRRLHHRSLQAEDFGRGEAHHEPARRRYRLRARRRGDLAGEHEIAEVRRDAGDVRRDDGLRRNARSAGAVCAAAVVSWARTWVGWASWTRC